MAKSKKIVRISIRWKIFIVMLAVSVLPLTFFTSFTAISQYRDVYNRMIIENKNRILNGEEHLNTFIEEMKNTFYTIELDRNFKEALTDSTSESAGYFSAIRKTMLAQLDRKTNYSIIELYLVNSDIKVTVSRSGSFRTGEEDNESVFKRPKGIQTNMFVKEKDGELYAVHHVNTFPEKLLLAKIAIKLKKNIFEDTIKSLGTYDSDTVYLLNDENEIIFSVGDAKQEVLNKSISQRNTEDFSGTPLELDNYYVLFGNSNGRKINIVKMVSKAEILNSVLPTVYAGILWGVICVIAAIFFSALLSYIVSKPIVALTKKVKNISVETLEMPEEIYSTDEVAILEDHITLFVKEIKDLILKEYETKLEAKSAQIKALQAQINPHFLYNTLQLMGSISLTQDANKVYTIATALGDILRYSMNFKEVFVTLDEELRNVNNYLLIQQTRYYDKFRVVMQIADETRDYQVPKMILQPLVENSFRHGFEFSTEEWVLQIQSYLENERVIIMIKDNGVGIPSDQLQSINKLLSVKEPQINNESHIGLVNVNSRIKLHYTDEDGVTVSSEEGKGTEVKVILTAKYKEGYNSGV